MPPLKSANHIWGDYERRFLFAQTTRSLLGPEMIEDAPIIVNESIKSKVQINLIFKIPGDGSVPLIAQNSPKGFILKSSGAYSKFLDLKSPRGKDSPGNKEFSPNKKNSL